MPLWTAFVDLIYAALFALSGVFGGNIALAIAALSVIVRIALLPLTLRLAYRSLEIQAKLKVVQPQLAELQRRFKNDRQRLVDETAKLYRANDLRLFDVRSYLGTLVQAPFFLGILSAVRRVKDLTKPDGLLLAIGATIAGVTATLAPGLTAQQRPVMFIVAAAIALVVLSRMAATMTIYSIASGSVGVLQAVLVRRRAQRISGRG